MNYFGIAHRLISMRIGLWNFSSIDIIFIWVLVLIQNKPGYALQFDNLHNRHKKVMQLAVVIKSVVRHSSENCQAVSQS